jgi:hypothetical protein
VNGQLLSFAEARRCIIDLMIGDGMRRMIVVVICIVVVMFCVSRLGSMLVRFEDDMHVRKEKENQIRSQSHRAARSQPNRSVFSCSQNESFL